MTAADERGNCNFVMRRKLLAAGLAALAAGSLAAAEPAANATSASASAAPAKGTKQAAVIETSKGTMVLELWPDVAPKTVANFVKLANKGFYDGTCFHRIIQGFMIQGGDPLTKDSKKKDLWGAGGPGYTIPAEFNKRHHLLGVISMARGLDPDSAGSQFFICLGDARYLDGKYTAFGKVIKGIETLRKIGETPVTWNRFHTEKSAPLERVEVKKIRVVPADQVR